jgi:hypothetical protein
MVDCRASLSVLPGDTRVVCFPSLTPCAFLCSTDDWRQRCEYRPRAGRRTLPADFIREAMNSAEESEEREEHL